MGQSHTHSESEQAAFAQRTVWFVALVVFIDMMGVSIIIPVMPDLITSLSETSIGEAAGVGGYLFAAYAVMQLIFAPIMGGLSDRFGRRPVLLLALTGLAIDYIILAVAPDLFWLFVGRILAGIMGATWPVANACVADVSNKETRAKFFGIVAGAAGVGFVFGPILGGSLAIYAGSRAPFVAAAALTFIAAGVGLGLLKETLRKENRRAFDWRRANPLGGLMKIAHYQSVLGILLALFLMQFAWTSFSVVWPYFTIEAFDWTEREIGISVSLYGLLIAIVQGGLTGPATDRFGQVPVCVFAIILGIGIYGAYAVLMTGWLAYVLIVISAPTAFAGPIMQTLMTDRVADDQQGELQGVIASAMAVNAIISPLVMTGVFELYTSNEAPIYLPGTPFAVSAILVTACLIVFLSATRSSRKSAKARVLDGTKR
ncbi:MAG: TCR/Tet family MFS transporter [Pseudomonadota bacterium]